MGGWALPVFVVPLLLTQFSFRRYAAIRASSLQTIRALSRVTELGGYTETGHSRRVSELSVAVGRELGMSDADLLDLEYAALMHDIGQLSLTEPIPGGATVVAAPADQRRIAALGAEVIRQTGVLDAVATIVDSRPSPTAGRTRRSDPTVPLASRIIKAVNAYDDLVGESYETDRAARRPGAAAAGDGLRVRPAGGGLLVQDRRSELELAAAVAASDAAPTRSSRPTPAATSTSPGLTTCGLQRQRDRHPSPSQRRATCDGTQRLAHRVVARCRASAAMPARRRGVDRHRHRAVGGHDHDVEQQAQADERQSRQTRRLPQTKSADQQQPSAPARSPGAAPSRAPVPPYRPGRTAAATQPARRAAAERARSPPAAASRA